MTEAEQIHKAQTAGLKAFKKLSLTERLKRLRELGMVDSQGDLTPAYGGAPKPLKKKKKSATEASASCA